MFSRKLSKPIAAAAAAIALGIGAYAVGNSVSGNGPSATATVAPAAQSAPATTGQAPPNWSPGSGTIITGAAADKAKAVAVAAYPGGTVNRVLQLSDGSYAVHRINVASPHHIFVSKDFKVTGTA